MPLLISFRSPQGDQSRNLVGLAAGWVEPWCRVAAACVLLNLPYWLLGQWLFVSRPCFNVELVVLLIAAAQSRRVGAVLLAVAWLFDLAVSQSFTYHFQSPFEFVRSLSFVGSIHLLHFVSVTNAALAVPFGLCAVGAFAVLPTAAKTWKPAITLILLLSVLDVGNGSSMFWERATRTFPMNITGSPTLTLVVKAWTERNPAPLRALPSGTSAVDKADLPKWISQHPNGSIVLVIVESMGKAHDPALNTWLRHQLFDPTLAARFDLAEPPVRFAGSTTSGELRELCGLAGSYRRLLAGANTDCLPKRLERLGWQTAGVHGFSGHMFDRVDWWPILGLRKRLFAEDIVALGMPTCGGAFTGVCDAELIDIALREAASPRRFVYALTLNSHLPLAEIPIPAELNAVCIRVRVGPNACLITATIGRALRSLRDGLKTARLADMAVIVVGDHAPPFSELEDRTVYDTTHVASYILTSRQ